MTTSPSTTQRWAATIAVPALALALLIPLIGPADAASADIARIGSATTATGTSTVTVATPAGVQEGDVLIAVLGSNSGIGFEIQAPATWNLGGPNWGELAAFWHIAGPVEPANYEFGHTNVGASLSVVLTAYRGVDPITPISATSLVTGYNTAPMAAGVTTTAPGAILLAAFRIDGGSAPGAPTGMSQVGAQFGAAAANVTVFDEMLTAAGSTGPRVTPDPAVGNWDGMAIALTPLPTAAVTPGALTESTLNSAIITVQVTGTTFVAAPAASDFTLNGAPAGTTISGVRLDSSSQVTLTLAFDGTDFDTDATPTVTVAAAALTSGQSITSGAFTIVAEAAAAVPVVAQLPATGPAASLSGIATLALALLGFGMFALVFSRRRAEIE